MGSDSYCLSSISVTEHMESGKVVANYVATHSNHQIFLNECKHLPLPHSVKTEVQTMLANGVQLETVLDGNPFFIMNMCVCTLLKMSCYSSITMCHCLLVIRALIRALRYSVYLSVCLR